MGCSRYHWFDSHEQIQRWRGHVECRENYGRWCWRTWWSTPRTAQRNGRSAFFPGLHWSWCVCLHQWRCQLGKQHERCDGFFAYGRRRLAQFAVAVRRHRCGWKGLCRLAGLPFSERLCGERYRDEQFNRWNTLEPAGTNSNRSRYEYGRCLPAWDRSEPGNVWWHRRCNGALLLLPGFKLRQHYMPVGGWLREFPRRRQHMDARRTLSRPHECE